jgi:hypothetical protein
MLFWNVLVSKFEQEMRATLTEHSRTFLNLLEHSKILENLLELSINLLEHYMNLEYSINLLGHSIKLLGHSRIMYRKNSIYRPGGIHFFSTHNF